MCKALYLASSLPLPESKWNERNPGLYVEAVPESEAAVRRHFSKPHVYYAGAHEGCGCVLILCLVRGLHASNVNSFLIKYGNALFIAIAIGSGAGIIFVETPFNAPFTLAFRQLTIPIFVIIAGYTLLNHRELIALTRSRTKVCATALMLFPLLVLFSGGWISLLNAACGNGGLLTYDGPVQRKFETGGRTRGWHIEILDTSQGMPITFNVSPKVYAAISVGERYHRSMQKGCFGIPYQIRNR